MVRGREGLVTSEVQVVSDVFVSPQPSHDNTSHYRALRVPLYLSADRIIKQSVDDSLLMLRKVTERIGNNLLTLSHSRVYESVPAKLLSLLERV